MVSLSRVFELIARHTTDLVCIHDAENTIRFATPSSRQILGYRSEEIIGKKLTDFLSEDFIHEMDFSTLVRFFDHPGARIRFQIKHQDKRLRWLETTFTRIDAAISPQYSILSSTRDITESVHLTEDLMNALSKEQEISRFKSNLYSIASHEFKTPLAVIQANIEMLKVKRSPKVLDNALASIEEEIDQLNSMIMNMLELKKLTVGQTTFRPENLSLRELIQEVIEDNIKKAYPDMKIVFTEKGAEKEIQGDYTLLRFVFSNLLSNSCKFSPAKGEIKVIAEYGEEEVRVSIIDQGIGIPEDEHQKIFGSFYRARNAGNVQGTGVGLAIVKEFVDLHGGNVSLISQPGKGSTFSVCFKK